jgi:hypothetical protein
LFFESHGFNGSLLLVCALAIAEEILFGWKKFLDCARNDKAKKIATESAPLAERPKYYFFNVPVFLSNP